MSVDTTAVGGPSRADLQRRIDEAVAQTVAADTKATALVTAAGLMAAVLTALASRHGPDPSRWLVVAAAGCALLVAVSLVALLLALRPRLSAGTDGTSFVALGRQTVASGGEVPKVAELQVLGTRLSAISRIALRKYRLIALAVDCLAGAVAGGAAILMTMLFR